MKMFLILVLGFALLLAAFATRPGKGELALYLLERQGSSLDQSNLDTARRTLSEVTVKDYYLWVDIERDGKVVYTGAFAHFVPRGESLNGSQLNVGISELAHMVGK